MKIVNNIDAAIESVYRKLSSLTQEEFLRRLESHKTGSIAKIILETKALSVGEIESKSFYPTFEPCDLYSAESDLWDKQPNTLDQISDKEYERVETLQDRVLNLQYDIDFELKNVLALTIKSASEQIESIAMNLSEIQSEIELTFVKKLIEKEDEEIYYFDSELKWAA